MPAVSSSVPDRVKTKLDVNSPSSPAAEVKAMSVISISVGALLAKAVSFVVMFLKECKTSFLLLARAHMMKIKTVQRYTRAFRRITMERIAIISRVLDVFYHQLLVHLHIGKYDNNNFGSLSIL